MCDTLKTTRGGSDGDSLFRRGLTYRDNDTLLCLVVLLGSIGHIHYPKGLGSTIPGDTPTVAKLPDEELTVRDNNSLYERNNYGPDWCWCRWVEERLS